jgi:hypothetical protein
MKLLKQKKHLFNIVFGDELFKSIQFSITIKYLGGSTLYSSQTMSNLPVSSVSESIRCLVQNKMF